MLGFSVSNSMEGKRYDKALEHAILQGLETAGIVIEGEAVTRAPLKTGRLKGSITYAVRGKRSYARSPAGPMDEVSAPSDRYTLYVGTNVEYAQHVEYGTVRTRGAKKPYLVPALINRARDVQKIVRDTMREAISRGR